MTSELNIVISIIITIVFGYFFYYKSKISKSLVLHYSASVVQEKYHPEIILQYQKNSINKLCKLIVVIFNGGNTEIRASDFPKGKIPQINFATGLKLLSYKILDKSNESFKLDVNQLKQGALSTKFDYLNPKDGFILEILYDATDEIKKPLKFSAPLIGGKIRIFNSESNSIKYLLIV